MHKPAICENVDSGKTKAPIFTTDINILCMVSMHRIVKHHIDASIHFDELLHPYLKYSAWKLYGVL